MKNTPINDVSCDAEGEGKQQAFTLKLPSAEAVLVYSVLLTMQNEAERAMLATPEKSGERLEAIKNVGRLSDIRAAMRRAFIRHLPNIKAVEMLEASLLSGL